MARPTVNTNPVANQYAGTGERIVEFGSGKSGGPGGLISFTRNDDGSLSVNLYRLDPGVVVHVSKPERPRVQVVPSIGDPGKFQAQYYNTSIGTWSDIGDSTETHDAALIKMDAFADGTF